MSDYFKYACGSCNQSIEVLTEQMSGCCRCPYCNEVEVPAPARNLRTQQAGQTLGKTFLIAFGAIFLFCGVISGILPAIGAALIVVAIIVVPAYLFTTIGTDLLYRNNDQYQDYRSNGGHPFWDNYLRKTDVYIKLPNPEPVYNEFTPPGNWKYQCVTCNARVQEFNGNCWCCGIEFDSSSNRADLWLN